MSTMVPVGGWQWCTECLVTFDLEYGAGFGGGIGAPSV